MHKTLKLLAGATLALATLGAASSASALVNGNMLLTVDENGNGTLDGFIAPSALDFALVDDPGPGGLTGVLTYDMQNPPGLVSGDVLFLEGGLILDVVRFNASETGPGGGVGSLLFYSDNLDGFDAIGDTPAPPGALYPNNITIAEVNGIADYTPTVGQPGFVAGAGAPVEYKFISDVGAPVPEPGTWVMLLVGVGALGAAARRRRGLALA